jgi:hypothetical protein
LTYLKYNRNPPICQPEKSAFFTHKKKGKKGRFRYQLSLRVHKFLGKPQAAMSPLSSLKK